MSKHHLELPTDGQIIFEGEPLSDGNINLKRRKIGFVFQSFNLFHNMNVLDNLTVAPQMHTNTDRPIKDRLMFWKALKDKKAERGVREERAHRLLERFNLLEKVKQSSSSLSGGEKQRVAIIRALMNEPTIMLFDEPTSALDPYMVKEVLDVIEELAEAGQTMVIVTHEMKFARNIADRMIFVHEGKIEEQGSPDEFFDNPKSEHLKAFLSRILD